MREKIIEISFDRGHGTTVMYVFVINCDYFHNFWQSKRTCFREFTILRLLINWNTSNVSR